VISVLKRSPRVLFSGDHANMRVSGGNASLSKLAVADIDIGTCLPKDSRKPSSREEVENIFSSGWVRSQLKWVVECCRLRVDIDAQCWATRKNAGCRKQWALGLIYKRGAYQLGFFHIP
jgi:hypothetical protein